MSYEVFTERESAVVALEFMHEIVVDFLDFGNIEVTQVVVALLQLFKLLLRNVPEQHTKTKQL